MSKPDVDPRDHAALLLGMRIIRGAYGAADSLMASPGEIGKLASQKGGVLIVAYSALSYHWIDRMAWGRLGAGRDYLMDRIRDALVPALAEAVRPGATQSERAADQAGLEETLDGFQRQFAGFKSPLEASGKLEGSVPWEFGVWLSEFVQCPGDRDFIVRAATVCAEELRRLDAGTLLEAIDPSLGSVKDGAILLPCQGCPKKLRVPVGLGRVRITCPSCKHEQMLTT